MQKVLTIIPLLLVLLSAPVRAEEDEATLKRADSELQTLIDEAIERGAKWLADKQHPDGSFTSMYGTAYPMGPTALATLALLHSGVPRSDPRIRKAIDFIKSNVGVHPKTYSVSVAIMALAEFGRERRTGGAAGDRYADAPGGGFALAEPDLEWMQRMTDWLVSKQNGRGWRYPEGGLDHSNSQYALLALKEARRCGLRVREEVFAKALKHFLSAQEKRGPKVPRYEEKGGDGVYATERTRAPGFDRARGWGYVRPNPVTGSMTAAGVAAVAISKSCLRTPRWRPIVARGEQSVRDGLAWLGLNFTVRENPGAGPAWHFYYLYGLERAGVLSSVVYMGEHRWYAEGARFLVNGQGADGAWHGGSVVDHSFALLFLSRATSRSVGPATEKPLLDLTRGDRLPDRERGDLFRAAFAEMEALTEERRKGRASEFAFLGPSVISLLLPLLHDPEPGVRGRAASILRAVTGLAQGFDPAADADEREAAADRWTAWYLTSRKGLRLDRDARRIR